jgi:hypothetical protein
MWKAVSPLRRGGPCSTLRLVVDPELEGVTGRYFDGKLQSRALGEAYDTRFRSRLRGATDAAVGDVLA